MSAEAERATAALPLDADATGAGTVAGYTVLYDGADPASAAAVVDIDGARTVAVTDDPKTALAMTDSEHVGAPVRVTAPGTFTP